jgi:excisionase family DNA binding protein
MTVLCESNVGGAGGGSAPSGPVYLNKKQVAQRLNVSARTVDNLMRNGVLPYRKLGRLVRFELADVDAHLRVHCRVCRADGQIAKLKVKATAAN